MVNQTELQQKRLLIAICLYVADRYVNEVKDTLPVLILLHSVSLSKKCHARNSRVVHREQMGDLPLISFCRQYFCASK